MPALSSLAGQPFDAQSTYGDKVHFVHIYIVEPHPQAPDVSPYRGTVWEAEYSSVGQAYSYADRVANANLLSGVPGDHLILVDELGPGGSDNPVWCTYGPCPNCAFLIGQDGTVAESQTWVNAGDMQRAIDELF